MLIVGIDAVTVEADLRAGRLACPACGSALRPWGHATTREVRLFNRVEHRRLRRSICGSCAASHVLIPEDTLVRRRDGVEVVGAALVAKARGDGHRMIAARLGRPVSTVRGWLRRFSDVAVTVGELCTRWAHAIDPTHDRRHVGGSAFCDAVEAIGVLAVVAIRRFGPRPPWLLASVVTGGGLLSNTSSPFRPPR